MVDITNTGDIHGCVAQALHTHHEHLGDAGHHNDNDAAPMVPGPHIVKHATYIGMMNGSEATHNRLDHLMSNTQRLDPLTRQRIQSWIERNKTNDNEPANQWCVTG